MDPIVSKLNQAAAQKVTKSVESTVSQSGSSEFQKTFDNKITERFIEKIREDFGMNSQNEMTVLSADDIHIETSQGEFNPDKANASFSGQFNGMFEEVNKGLLSLDSTMEILTNPGVKISPRQLLALQAGMANVTLLAESVSRATDGVARGIQTILQTQMG